jgi:NADPH:quinone reductase-like Zn-dependent oxidoreductase
MLAASINPSDLVTISGAYGSRTALPFVPGFEGVGVIEETAADAEGLQVGDRVLPLGSAGAWQDVKVTEARWCFPVASALSHEQAATSYINPLTAWLMVREHVPPYAQTRVAVNAAASAIGSILIRMMNRVCVRPIAIVRRPDSRRHLAGLQLSSVLCIADCDGPDALREATDGHGLAVAFDAVGGPEGGRLVRALAPGGTLVHYGLLSGHPLPPTLGAERRDTRIKLFRLRDWIHSVDRPQLQRALDDVFRQVLDGTATTTVASVHTLSDVRRALELNRSQNRRGKLLLRWN